MEIGKIIMNLRKDKGWSQSELAKKTDVSQVMIGKYERGDAIPSFDVAKKIADALEVSLEVLGGNDEEDFNQEVVQKMKEIQTLDKDTQSILFNIINTYLRDAKARQAYS
ncbi:helix-turn-helix domain-containing protein [Aureispira sp. CCB-QB1]|uniref:helix-turn-helix domain-containing protein n=1 Tax=Aureispira sp. CCB-QB1 TaxID=1313421 RepID=UPI0006976F80|nr:helix-turn-helix transcriptional regulator [Aureispira sp. CCB-QB1]